MSKIRIYELAKQLGVANKDLVAKINSIGIEAKSHMAMLTEEEAAKVTALYQPKKEEPKKDAPKKDAPKQNQPKQNQPKQNQPKQDGQKKENDRRQDGNRPAQKKDNRNEGRSNESRNENKQGKGNNNNNNNKQGGQNNNPTHQIVTEPILSENIKRNAYCKSRSSTNALPYRQPEQEFLLVFRYFFRYFYFNQFADLLTSSLRYVSPKLPNSLRLYPASVWLSDLKCRRE